MKYAHPIAIVLACLGAVVLLAGMLFGAHKSVNDLIAVDINVDRSVRDVSLALWTFLLPAWFSVEEQWFSPEERDAAKKNRFAEGQKKARYTWTVVAGAMAIILGISAPSSTPPKPSAAAPTSLNAERQAPAHE